ncbi:SDR family oxidoreductase [Rhizobium sp. S163]|uniref:SDR family NAD(P)-dependent oxidoreductase n=1 Tax=Rhizobium sp. S163 TaxID=3055039 RepID=UPI0025A9A2B9|nr:SDR family oxidoreductase [Rhizobium sp. S163]MDM9646394.1 SDR family oxidoreductase [Rhizobium sp. S163]
MQDSPFTRYRSLEERVVLVTGGGSGIGATLVDAFLAQGSRVHFIDFDQGAGQNVSTEVGGTFHHCDLRDINALRRVISQIEEMEGAIDVLVNNAGNDDRHDMFAVEPDYWRDRLAVNLDHQFFAAQAVSAGMKRRGQGCILFTSSTSFMKGRPGMVAYTTSKAAIIGLNKTLARELGASGVRANCIIPGAISTSRQDALWRTSEGEAEIMKMQAIKIRLVARDVAAMALFLASDDARGCTGAQFLVDAGIT